MLWSPRTNPKIKKLRKENDGLRTVICCLRREIENKQGAVGRLEVLLRERLTKIDSLTDTIDQLREQNKKLDLETELLAAMVRLEPAQQDRLSQSH